MSNKHTLNTIAGALTLLVALPLWFYLMSYILQAAGASSEVWVVFGVYITTHMIAAIIDFCSCMSCQLADLIL